MGNGFVWFVWSYARSWVMGDGLWVTHGSGVIGKEHRDGQMTIYD